MSHVLASGLCYLIFSVMGFGPCLMLVRGSERVLSALCLAAPAGFACTVLMGSIFVRLDLPVNQWAYAWLVLAVAASCACIVVDQRRNNLIAGFKTSLASNLHVICGTAAAFAIVMASVLAGGLTFTVMRGNVIDALNYTALAHMLDLERLSWMSGAGFQELLDRHYHYAFGLNPNMFAWSVSVPLAWSARIMQLPICPFDFAYTSMLTVMLFGPLVLLARISGLGQWTSSLAALGMCVGFYPQFMIDMRSLSQISIMPFVVSFGVLVAKIESDSIERRFRSREFWLLAVFWTAIVLIYIQIIFFIALGMAIFLCALLVMRKIKWSAVADYIALFAGSLVVTAAIQPMTYLFNRIVGLAMNTGFNDQLLGNYNWLFDNPVSSAWGLFLFGLNPDLMGLFTASGVEAILMLLGLLLTILLCAALYFSFLSKRSTISVVMLAAFAFAEVIQFAGLCLIGKTYSAARGLSYCFPFFMLCALAYAIWKGRESKSWMLPLNRALAGLLIVSQIILGPYRAACILGDKPDLISAYPFHYPYNDWDLTGICNALKGRGAMEVGLLSAGNYMSHYAGYVLEPSVHLVALDGVQNQVSSEIGYPRSAPPELIITDKKFWESPANVLTEDRSQARLIAANSAVLLLQVPKEFWERPLACAVLNRDPRPNPRYLGMYCRLKTGIREVASENAQLAGQNAMLGFGARTSVCFNAFRAGKMNVVLKCQSHIRNQKLTVRVDNNEIGVCEMPQPLVPYEFTLPFNVQPYFHQVDIQYAAWDPGPTQAAVLFREFNVIESPPSDKK